LKNYQKNTSENQMLTKKFVFYTKILTKIFAR